MTTRYQRALSNFRRKTNIETQTGFLGDGTGETHDRTTPGNFWVRFPAAAGGLTAPVSLPLMTNANLKPDDGIMVEVGMWKSRPVILGMRLDSLSAAGINPIQLNPADPTNEYLGAIRQYQIITFKAIPHGDVTNKPFYATVLPGVFYVSGVPYFFVGDAIDLSSFVPGAGEHLYASVFMKTDRTLEAFASTAIPDSDPLSDVDLQEADALKTAGSYPVWAWELRGDDASLTVDPARQVDLRQAFGSGNVTFTATPASVFDVAGSGTSSIALSMDVQAANTVLSGPASGPSDVPAFRTLGHSELAGLTTGDDHTQYLLRQPSADWTIDNGALRLGGIGGAAVAAQKLTIYTGAATNKGLVVKAAASQSAAVFQVQNSAASPVFEVAASGHVGVAALSNATSTLNVAETVADPTGTYSGMKVLNSYSITADNTRQMEGLRGEADLNQNGFNATGSIIGTNSRVLITGAAGSVSAAYALQNTASNTGAGTVTNLYGILVVSPGNSGGGTVTNAYGIEIQAVNVGSSFNSALRTASGLVTFNESGDGASDFRVEGDNDVNLTFNKASTDRVGHGTAAPTTKLHVLLTDAGTNAVVNALTVGHDTSGTAAAGFGAGVIVELESSTAASQSAGRLTYEWATATHASRKARGKLTVFDTAEREAITFEADGALPLVGIGTSGTPGALLDINGYYRWKGAKRVSTQFDKTSDTTLATVTGLSVTVVAGKTYGFRATMHETGGPGGHKCAISGTATATAIVYDIHAVDMTSQQIDICVRATALGTSGGETTGSDHYTSIDGLITVNAGGTLLVQFAQNNSNGTASSILVGSTFFVWEIE